MAPTAADLLKRNEEYATNHKPLPLIKEIQASGRNLPGTVIITCADPRVMPQSVLGLKELEALVFRTVAGHPQPALQAIAALDIQAHGFLEEIMIMYHTDCGSQYFEVPRIRAGLIERDPSLSSQIENEHFGAIGKEHGSEDLEDSLRKDVEWVKRQLIIKRDVVVKGCLYDIHTGRVKQIV